MKFKNYINEDTIKGTSYSNLNGNKVPRLKANELYGVRGSKNSKEAGKVSIYIGKKLSDLVEGTWPYKRNAKTWYIHIWAVIKDEEPWEEGEEWFIDPNKSGKLLESYKVT